jgi:hypothetical protein
LGPKTVARRELGALAVAVLSFLDLIVPCAMAAFDIGFQLRKWKNSPGQQQVEEMVGKAQLF